MSPEPYKNGSINGNDQETAKHFLSVIVYKRWAWLGEEDQYHLCFVGFSRRYCSITAPDCWSHSSVLIFNLFSPRGTASIGVLTRLPMKVSTAFLPRSVVSANPVGSYFFSFLFNRAVIDQKPSRIFKWQYTGLKRMEARTDRCDASSSLLRYRSSSRPIAVQDINVVKAIDCVR